MSGSYLERSRERMRHELLAAAADEVLARGWRGLRMQVVAEAVGVSRQTVHNEFATKRGLAMALVLSTTSPYLEDEERIVRDSTDLRSALRDTVHHALTVAADDRFLKTVFSSDGSATFLPLYTSEAGPLIDFVSDRMAGAFSARWPEINPERLRISTESITRQLISHIMLPTHPKDQIAEQLADLHSQYLADGVGTRPR